MNEQTSHGDPNGIPQDHTLKIILLILFVFITAVTLLSIVRNTVVESEKEFRHTGAIGEVESGSESRDGGVSPSSPCVPTSTNPKGVGKEGNLR